MKKLILFSLILSSISTFANQQTVGIAINSISTIYKGKKQIKPLPLINLQYNDFFIKGTNFGYSLYSEPNFSFSAIINPTYGYFNGWAIKNSDMDNGINISSRSTQIMAGFGSNFSFSENVFGHASYLFGKHGSTGNIVVNKVYNINDSINIIPAIDFNFYQKNFTNYYVGVSEKEVKNSSKLDKTFKGKNAFSGGVSLTGEYYITEQITTTAFVGIEYFNKNISNSPIVNKNHQIYGGIGIRYSF